MKTWLVLARQALDRAVAAYDPKPSCKAIGCFGCCTGPIAVHKDELDDLLPHVTEAQRAAARAIADRMSPYWCPLLDRKSGRCTVYAKRPLICRGHAAITPARHCQPEAKKRVQRHPMQNVALGDALDASGLERRLYFEGVRFLADALAEPVP